MHIHQHTWTSKCLCVCLLWFDGVRLSIWIALNASTVCAFIFEVIEPWTIAINNFSWLTLKTIRIAKIRSSSWLQKITWNLALQCKKKNKKPTFLVFCFSCFAQKVSNKCYTLQNDICLIFPTWNRFCMFLFSHIISDRNGMIAAIWLLSAVDNIAYVCVAFHFPFTFVFIPICSMPTNCMTTYRNRYSTFIARVTCCCSAKKYHFFCKSLIRIYISFGNKSSKTTTKRYVFLTWLLSWHCFCFSRYHSISNCTYCQIESHIIYYLYSLEFACNTKKC